MALIAKMSRTRIASYALSAAVVLVLLGVFVRMGYVVADAFTEPYAVTEAVVVTPKIEPGEPLKVLYTMERRRICSTTIAEFWIDRDTGQALVRGRVPGGYMAVGTRKTLVILQVPFPMEPGRYTYRSVMESDCGFNSFAHQAPDADFEIVAPP